MKRVDGSFRDPDGFMFDYQGEFYRAVNHSYKPDYDHLIKSGLYQELLNQGLTVSFVEMNPSIFGLSSVYCVLKPEQIQFITYPYEWAFDMLRDAALLTVRIQNLALKYGMGLKDASAFNIQFVRGLPVLIDHLSFEIYSEGKPWVAYRQFCEHFIAPLALMSFVDPTLNLLLISHVDGIPIQLASKILPVKCRFSIGLYLHLYLHAKVQKKYQSTFTKNRTAYRYFSQRSMVNLLSGLRSLVESLRLNIKGTEWAGYTNEGVHLLDYIEAKQRIISAWLDEIHPHVIWDLGANTGVFSRLAAAKGIEVLSLDKDPACVENNYKMVKRDHEAKILPLLLNLINPSPSIGWGGKERHSFYSRNEPDLLLALAIIHHLAISENIPLERIAEQFSNLANNLIIEFVPKNDPKVQRLLLNREDIFFGYTLEFFEAVFSKFYIIKRKQEIYSSQRILYYMKRIQG